MMTLFVRPAAMNDAAAVAMLMTELGYPSTGEEVQSRLDHVVNSATSCCLVAQLETNIVGLINAELTPYFPTGSTICRVTSLVVAAGWRRRGVGQTLLAAATAFAREHRCSGIEVTSAERRLDAHRFYEKLGFSRTAFRFFHPL